jgi:hypothetical protein
MLFLALSALGLLLYSVGLFYTESHRISFQEKIKNDDQILLEQLVDRALMVVKANDEIRAQLRTEKKTAAIEKYNKIANDYNSINQEIASSSFFTDHPDLKKSFIEANNAASASLATTYEWLSSKKPYRELASNSSSFVNQYEALKKHSALDSFNFKTFNKPTVEFLFGLMGFAVLSLLSLYSLIKSSRKLSNLLIQKESELKTFLSVIDNMSEGVIVSDRFGFFTYYNQSALEIIGPNIKDLYYQSSLDLIGFYDLQGHKLTKAELPFHKAVNKNIVTDQEILVNNPIHPNGIYISASNGFFVDNKGDTLGSVVVMKNISHKKQLEELWKKEKELAIDGSKKKSDFLASMSHEIRTPMNGIIGLTTLLSESPLDEQQSEFVNIIRRSANSLLSLINDILDHSKIESGKIELIQNNFDIKFLVKDIIENFRFACTEKNNQIQFECSENLNSYFLADENRIRQILMNLVGNAVKFTTNGKITIKIDLQKDSDKSSQLRFSVNDTGPGMDKAELERLFQRFFQTKTGIKFGGTGLGLSICKQLVDLMNGKIGVDSQPGLGSTFWFELDLLKGINEVNSSKNIKLSDFANTFSGHILVAEDNIINQKVIYQYLTKLGFTVDMANNGHDAVEFFQKNPYDLILMDCNMPVLNGYEATRKINQLQSHIDLNKQVKIVALTAEGQITGLNKCLEAGMTDFINKPILIEEFISVLKKYVFSFQKTSLYKLKDLTVGDQLLLEVLLEEFAQSTPKIIESMSKFYDTQDYESLADAAHSLKSSSGALGAKKVQAICQTIEDIKHNPDLINIKNLLLDLESEFKISLNDIQYEVELIKASPSKASA